MKDNKCTTAIINFVAYCIIIIIGLYLMASAIVSFVYVTHQTFTIIFTVAGGIPALASLFNDRYGASKTIS